MSSTPTAIELSGNERFLIGKWMTTGPEGDIEITHAKEHNGFPSTHRGPVLTGYGLVGDQVWIQPCWLSPAGVGVYEGPTMPSSMIRDNPHKAPINPQWFEEAEIPYRTWREQALAHAP
jgi:hypothetical protein